MNEKETLNLIDSCIDCKKCLEVCDTYEVTGDINKSPNGRLKIANKVFLKNDITQEELYGIYTCTLCGLCDLECQSNIPISRIIQETKFKLVRQGLAPLEIHKKIIKGIIEDDNSVSGDPEQRLDWLPEQYKNDEVFEEKEAENLLFLGCMSSFRVKESASSSYELLTKAGLDFKILKNEPCCGEYAYSAGDLALSRTLFNDNYELFKKIGIKQIITTCGGCLYAFNNVYPKFVKNWDIQVTHITQVIQDLEKNQKLQFTKNNESVFYHDACRMGRKLKSQTFYEQPRYLLNKTCKEVKEFPHNKENTLCCGAGSGIRGVDKDITIKIGEKLINSANPGTSELISSCPLCIFNYRYIDYKLKLDKKFTYITEYLLNSLKG